MKYKVGQLVMHEALGLGRVVGVRDDHVTVFFRDQAENPRTINIAVVAMTLAESQSDECLDNVALLQKRMRICATRQRKKRAEALSLPR